MLILTGYLGAGKTTLLNYILKEQTDKKLAVIENEIGEVSVDDALVENNNQELAEELITLDNGCVCCTIRGDLLKTLQDLQVKVSSGKLNIDGILVELTGAADPAPVVQTFMLDANVRKSFYIDNVIALVDAKHAIGKLDEGKGDNAKGTACAQIAFSSTVLLNKVDLVDKAQIDKVEGRIKELNKAAHIIHCEQAMVSMERLFNVRCFDLAAVLEEQYMDEEEFNNFYKPKMDNTISNVGLKFEGQVNMFQFQEFLDKLIGDEEQAMNFMRIKGVLNISGADKMFVLQCVHMLRNQNFTKPWPEGQDPTKRENRIIFIGRGMQARRQELIDGMEACKAKPLRFKVGEKVRAKVGEGPDDYELGTIVAHWDAFHAYRIRLSSDGGDVRAPMDIDDFVMAAR